ncbi:MAG: hypothetical protein IJR49_01630, partial [Treponema sp.]|nr:hypothetical protein [Treponema sp.]
MENAFQMTSYIALPLVIIAFLALVHLLLLFIVKTRSTAKTSFILFSALALFALGAIYSLYSKNTFIFVCDTLISQIALHPYLFILAKGFKKNNGKTKLQEGQEQSRLSNISQEKFNDMFALTKDLAEAASQSISHSTDINEFLDFFASKLITATKAEGCAILLADEFENFLTVHSLLGNFPPIYKLPESVELEKEAVQEHIKNMQFQFNGNIFGEAAFSPVALLIKNASKDKRIYQNGNEDFLSCGSFIFMPLRLPNTSGAVIALSRSSNSPSFSEEELEEAKFINESLATVIMPLASFLEYNEHQELNKEGEAAIKFHRFLLQEKFSKFNTFTLGCWTQ